MLLALLAWAGVLAQRLACSKRRAAAKRLRALLTPPAGEYSELEPISPLARAVGQVAFREEMDLMQEMVGDFVCGDPVTFDVGGGGDDGGGSDGGGGGGD